MNTWSRDLIKKPLKEQQARAYPVLMSFLIWSRGTSSLFMFSRTFEISFWFIIPGSNVLFVRQQLITIQGVITTLQQYNRMILFAKTNNI